MLVLPGIEFWVPNQDCNQTGLASHHETGVDLNLSNKIFSYLRGLRGTTVAVVYSSYGGLKRRPSCGRVSSL